MGPLLHEHGLVVWLNDRLIRHHALHHVVQAMGSYGIAVALAAIAVAGVVVARRRDRAAPTLWRAAAAIAVAEGVALLLKALVDRPRPFSHGTSAHGVVRESSFPSGPAAVGAALTVSLWPVSRRLAIVAGVVTLLGTTAEVATGGHWPSDVLAGYALGAATALAARAR